MRADAADPGQQRIASRADSNGNGHDSVPAVMVDLRHADPIMSDNAATDGGRVIRYSPGKYERLVKPILDRIVGAALLLPALPILAVISTMIWLTMGRPVMIRQQRVGRQGWVFEMYKFRTMELDRRQQQSPMDGPDRRRTHKSPEDPRLTRLGRFLRKWSLDELPQLWHVTLGQMSLVGPRPELVLIVERYQPWQHQRHLVKPGLTGIWQVTARGNGLMHEHTDLDLLYLERISLLTDLKILFLTVPAAIGLRRGF